MGAAAIAVSGLTKRYGPQTVVDDVSFSVAAGEVFAYLGRNGSGKTTTVRMLTTLTTPTSGTARVAGIDVVAEPQAVKAKIGVTMQDAALDPQMSGREHLEFIAAILGHKGHGVTERSDEMLELFGLTDAADQASATYSGGMRRRLDIATALLGEPEVLFLDEPTTGLDPQSRRAMWDEIRSLKARGVTIFLTTQYLEEAELLADRLAILDRGAIIAGGTVDDLKSQHARKHLSFNASPFSSTGLAAELRARHTDVEARVEGNRLIVDAPSTMPDDDLLALGASIAERHGPIEGLAIAATSLEDVFLRLTGTDINESTDRSTVTART